jgi:glycosyltransferase involved in cell wall biosynthesis
LNLPYSFTAHAHDIYVERPMLREKIHDARFVVTISEYNRRFLARLYPDLADNVTVIHCGVDLSAFEPQPRGELPAGPWTVVSVASLQPQKGHAYLVRACAILRARGIDVRCLFIGEGPEEASLRRQITDAGLDEVVHLLGALPRPRVIAALAGADAMALASVRLPKGKMEGIPVSLMEAMAMALPVVATDLSGVPELVRDGETGLLAPERDAEALASALASLHDDPDRAQRLAEAGRRHVAEAFDLRINTARLAALFEANLVAEGGSGGGR